MYRSASGEAEGSGFSLRFKLSYGSGQAVDAVLQGAVNTFLLFYLTTVCGMSGSAAGAVFLCSLVIDGLLDPWIGRTSDHWRSRWGRRLPFMVTAAIPMSACAILLFSLPRGLSDAMLFVYVLGLNVVLRVGLSVFALPHSALTAELTEDYAERSVLSTYRALFIVFGTAAVLLPAFTWIFAAPSGLEDRSAYPSFGLLVGILILGFATSCIVGSARRVLQLPVPIESPREAEHGLLGEIVQLFRNSSFASLFIGAILVLVGQGAATTLNLHAYRYFWKLPDWAIQTPIVAIPLGMLVGTIMAGLLLRRFEKRDVLIGAILVVALYAPLVTALLLAGIVDPASNTSVGLVVMNGALFGGCGATCFVCFYSMIADAVDEHDDLFGVRREALYAAALMIGAKAATGIGGFLGGAGLQLIGFEAASSTAAASGTNSDLGLLWGPGASIIVLLSVPFILRYRVNQAHHTEVLRRLAARQASTARDGSVVATSRPLV